MSIKKWWNIRKNKSLCKAGALPDYYCKYLESANKISLETPVSEIRFVVLDTETTGLDLNKDVLISIGAVQIDNLSIPTKSIFEVFVNQETAWTSNAVNIHEIIRSDVKKGISQEEAAKQFLEILGNSIFVAHHVYFDKKMIQKMIQNIIPDFEFVNTMLDTALLLKRVETTVQQRMYNTNMLKYDLDTVIDRHNLIAEDRHTAWGDAFTTAHLLLKIIKKIQAKKGTVKLKHLLKDD